MNCSIQAEAPPKNHHAAGGRRRRWLLLTLLALWLAACRAGTPQADGLAPLPVYYMGSDGVARQSLFVTEWVLGQKLYNGTGGESTRGAHGAVAASLGVLFGVNTVTGVWNMVESRKDPNHRTKRLVHSILMFAADAGFVATAAMAPGEDDYGVDYTSKRSTHRTVAISSMVTALVSYTIMLVGR